MAFAITATIIITSIRGSSDSNRYDIGDILTQQVAGDKSYSSSHHQQQQQQHSNKNKNLKMEEKDEALDLLVAVTVDTI